MWWEGLGMSHLPGEKQVKEEKPGSSEALDHTGPTAADVVSSSLSTEGL